MRLDPFLETILCAPHPWPNGMACHSLQTLPRRATNSQAPFPPSTTFRTTISTKTPQKLEVVHQQSLSKRYASFAPARKFLFRSSPSRSRKRLNRNAQSWMTPLRLDTQGVPSLPIPRPPLPYPCRYSKSPIKSQQFLRRRRRLARAAEFQGGRVAPRLC